MPEQDDSILKELGAIFLFVLVIGSLFEIGLLIFAYVNADKVECNLLWCTFTSGDTIEVRDSFRNITQTTTSTSECYINGEKVNCSEIDNYTKKWENFLP
jgi:hypothetical protein